MTKGLVNAHWGEGGQVSSKFTAVPHLDRVIPSVVGLDDYRLLHDAGTAESRSGGAHNRPSELQTE